MKSLIPVIILLAILISIPENVLAQKNKPKAKTDPSLTISRKKTKKAKAKIMKRRAKSMASLTDTQLNFYWRKEDAMSNV